MAKNDNPHSLRLYQSVLTHLGPEAAEKIACAAPLSKSAGAEKKFSWAEQVCKILDDEFDDASVGKVRMDCACGPAAGKIRQLKKLYASSATMDEFIDRINKLDQGFTMEHEDNLLFLVYPRCYCACANKLDKPLPRSWCYCTLGYTKRMFEGILDRHVDVKLIQSVKTGGSVCRIKITCEPSV